MAALGIAQHSALVEERRAALRPLCHELLAEAAPFVWEIGCGHGHFLTAYAQAHPEEFCVGIDLIPDRIARAERKRERAGVKNLRFIRAAAEDFLAVLPDSARFSALYLLFPDPWPKRRHHKYRVFGPLLLDAVANRMERAGRLYFRTDYEPYYAEAVAALRGRVEWRVEPERTWPFEVPTIFQQKAARYHSLVAVRA